jgi:hypothetical protein
MWRELLTLWQSIRDPEYAHLLLESLPLYGIGAGLIFLFASLAFREGKSRMLALLLICLSSASVWPYTELREKAQPRILATRDPSFGPLIREQAKRRADYAWAYYVMAGISGLALLLSSTSRGKFLLFATIICGTAMFWFSIWLHKKECEVYHRNIYKYSPQR